MKKCSDGPVYCGLPVPHLVSPSNQQDCSRDVLFAPFLNAVARGEKTVDEAWSEWQEYCRAHGISPVKGPTEPIK